MKWSSAVADHSTTDDALDEVCAAVRSALGGASPHLLVLFASPHHEAAFADMPARLAREFPGAHLLGCSAGGVIGGAREIEHRPGLSLTAASLPDVRVAPFHIGRTELPSADDGLDVWESAIGASAAEDPHFVLLPDPFSFDSEQLLSALDAHFPAATKIGGLASGGRAPGSNALWLDGETYRSGLVGVALSGNVTVDSIVAQGCRPIGVPMFVTRCRQNLLLDVDGRPVMEVLMELFQALPRRDQELLRHSLFLGVVMRADQQEYRHGDFLIRNIMGQERESKGLVVGALLHDGQVVQFHLRDAETSHDDLAAMLDRYQHAGAAATPAGALLFSCLGRGAHLYGRADHDTELFTQRLGTRALGGFFCNGEIGPVAGTTFLHGYTSSFGLFRAKR